MDQAAVFLSTFLNNLWAIIENWWWFPLPFILYGPFVFFWLWWRMEVWLSKQKKVLLEIRMPREVLKPLKSMDQTFSAIWGATYDPPDWWEKWVEGKQLDSIQLEMASIGGEPRLYLRCAEGRRNTIESALYSQYPEAEISAVEDYVKSVPQNLPNKDWEMWGCDYEMIKPDVYPIKTYHDFFEERQESKEEKRIDPMATLLEGMGKLTPGEQLWIQISAKPITNKENNFIDRGRQIADKIAKRPEKPKSKMIIEEAADELFFGKMPGQGEEKGPMDLLPPEMRITPGEKDVLTGIERKISNRCFSCYIRFIYLARKDVYFGGAKTIPFSFFNQFSTENMNALKPWPKTITKIHRYPIIDILRVRRTYIRKRALFFKYVRRMPPLFPKPGGTFILDTEELATIYHFPGRTVAPAPFVSRVESKRGEAPPGLPLE